jgi:hypothetical protein
MDGEINVRGTLRNGGSLSPLIKQAVDAKPQGHELSMDHYPGSRRMAQTGG